MNHRLYPWKEACQMDLLLYIMPQSSQICKYGIQSVTGGTHDTARIAGALTYGVQAAVRK